MKSCPVGSVTASVYPASSTVVIVSTPPATGSLTTSAVGTAVGSSGITKTTSTALQVTAAAGRVAGGVEFAAVAAGAVVVAFL